MCLSLVFSTPVHLWCRGPLGCDGLCFVLGCAITSIASTRAGLALLIMFGARLILPGKGAAELFTWAARDAAGLGTSLLRVPGFADYGRALRCWEANVTTSSLSLDWSAVFPQPFPRCFAPSADVLWICNPHNPTGQLWSCESLQPMLQRYALVICDEAFLP